MTSIENAIETVEHQIEIQSELPTENPVLRQVLFWIKSVRSCMDAVHRTGHSLCPNNSKRDFTFSDACLIDDGTAEPFDILGNDEKGDFDESCDSADSGEDVEIHLGKGLQLTCDVT